MIKPASGATQDVPHERPPNVKTDVTTDSLLGGRLRLRQPVSGYRAAIDPVLLAAAVPANSNDSVLDAGAGPGAALLCLAARVPHCRIVGLERDESAAQMAWENAGANGFADRVEILLGDVSQPPARLAQGSFDHVMMNPPHLDRGRAQAPADAGRAAAMVEDDTSLRDWIDFAYGMLRERGTLTLIHRADRADQLIASLPPRFGGITLFPLWPGGGRPAKRAILRARKNSREPAAILPGLVLHGNDGGYTPEAERVLREGRALEF